MVLIYQDPKAVIAAIADPTTDKIVEALCDFFNYERGFMSSDNEYATGRSYKFSLWDTEEGPHLFDYITIQTTQFIP